MEAGPPQPFNGADVDRAKLGRTRQAREYFIGIIFRNTFLKGRHRHGNIKIYKI